MKWYAIDKDYMNYLKQYDGIVPRIEYQNRMKCFIGVILKRDGIDYFAPLSSYKPKFAGLKNDMDFFKIVNPKTRKIYGAININNMIPVSHHCYTEITYENLDNFRSFFNEREKKQYWKLLNTELQFLKEDIIKQNAENLYKLVQNKPNSKLAKRCCDFQLLEEKCIEYNYKNLNNHIDKEDLNIDDIDLEM